jgi:hypothetical protein
MVRIPQYEILLTINRINGKKKEISSYGMPAPFLNRILYEKM